MNIKGKVIKGAGQAGGVFGVQTANLAIEQLDAYDGVYAAKVFLEGEQHNAIAFLGKAHLLENKPWQCEVHILAGKYDLYGKEVEVELVKKIRDTIVFTQKEEASERIQKDLEIVTDYFQQ
jgi:riboflavin kinase/FMN adenylyltransferase